MSDTPTKIDRSIDLLEKSLKLLSEDYSKLEDLSKTIYQHASESLEAFEDVPVERLRKIKTLIKDSQTKRDDLIDSMSRIEDFKKSLKELSESTKSLRQYFDEQYMDSVRIRSQRDR